MQLNSTFISNIKDVYGQVGEDWLIALPATIEQLSAQWNFHFLKPFPELSYSFVGLVQRHYPAELAVIKMVPPGGNILTEINWLKCIEKGVPKIYLADEERYVFLMEYLTPGSSLKHFVQAGQDDAATKIICATIKNLQIQRQTEFKFTHLSELSKALSLLQGQFDTKLLSQAISWFHDLTIDTTHDVILHGDLHHDNILASGVEWKAIDPHGYIGDPVAEVGAMIRNPLDCFPTHKSLVQIVERRLKIMADELAFDAQKIKAWAFCMTVLSAAWTLEGHHKVTQLEVEIAAAINQVKM